MQHPWISLGMPGLMISVILVGEKWTLPLGSMFEMGVVRSNEC